VLTGLLARDVTDQLGSIRAPTLVVRGVEDKARTAEHVRILCAGIPDSTSIEIRNSGHSPMVDQPAAFEQRKVWEREFEITQANPAQARQALQNHATSDHGNSPCQRERKQRQ